MWGNARLYNGPGHAVCVEADKMEVAAGKMLAGMTDENHFDMPRVEEVPEEVCTQVLFFALNYCLPSTTVLPFSTTVCLSQLLFAFLN